MGVPFFQFLVSEFRSDLGWFSGQVAVNLISGSLVFVGVGLEKHSGAVCGLVLGFLGALYSIGLFVFLGMRNECGLLYLKTGNPILATACGVGAANCVIVYFLD